MKRFLLPWMLPLSLSIAGCADALAPELHPRPGARMATGVIPPDGGEGDGEGIPPEFNTPPSIIRASTDVGFESGHAWTQAFMQYYGNRASQSVNLMLRTEGRVVETPGLEEAQHVLPAERALWTNATLRVTSSCGHVADGRGEHSAWSEFVTRNGSLLSWARQTRTTTGSAAQPACPAAPGEGGGKYFVGSEGGSLRCRTVTTDYYWYYPDTNTYEYRYSSDAVACSPEQSTTEAEGTGDLDGG